MKKQAYRMGAFFGLFFLLAAASAQAQSRSTITVSVPFDFHAGEQRLSTGEYSVRFISPRSMLIRSADGQTSAIIQVPLARENRDNNARERLVFRQYGDQYYLAQVWMNRTDGGRELYQSRAERQLVKELKLAKSAEATPRRVEVNARAGK